MDTESVTRSYLNTNLHSLSNKLPYTNTFIILNRYPDSFLDTKRYIQFHSHSKPHTLLDLDKDMDNHTYPDNVLDQHRDTDSHLHLDTHSLPQPHLKRDLQPDANPNLHMDTFSKCHPFNDKNAHIHPHPDSYPHTYPLPSMDSLPDSRTIVYP